MPEDLEMLRLWRRSRGGMGGAGPLPDPGGLLDQAAAMMAAFETMDLADAAWNRRRRPK
jgi:hypothetical protein